MYNEPDKDGLRDREGSANAQNIDYKKSRLTFPNRVGASLTKNIQ